jgi:hypothetical protein
VAVDGLDGIHVDGVDVGALLPVDLDAHEPVVHGRRHLGVLEALVGHDVAPVQAEYPTDRRTGLSSACARAKASSPHGYQSTGLSRCLAQVGRRLAGEPVHLGDATDVGLASAPHGDQTRWQGGAVTGASKGIGKSIAAGFVESGARVMLTSRKLEGLQAAAEEMKGDTAVFAANVGDIEAADACVRATIERFGRLDILVNNAATNPVRRAHDGDRPGPDSTRRSR